MSQNNNEIICTRISHPRELLYDTLQINHHEMIIFSPCVLSTAIRYQSPSLEKMNRTKIVKQIEIYRRMLKLTLQFKFASSIHEKPEEIENGGFTLKPIKCSPPASLRRNMKTQEFWICVCGKFGQRNHITVIVTPSFWKNLLTYKKPVWRTFSKMTQNDSHIYKAKEGCKSTFRLSKPLWEYLYQGIWTKSGHFLRLGVIFDKNVLKYKTVKYMLQCTYF